MKKLKIGILGSRGIPNQYGGFEQFAGYLSAGLLQRGHIVWVYNSHNHPYQQKEWNGVQLIHCRNPEQRLGTAGQFLYDRNCLRDAGKRNFDILLHLGYTSDSVWHRRWPKRAVNMVNMDGLEWKREKYNQLTKWFLKKAERLAAKHADIMVADSPVIQDYLAGQYGKEVFFIPYAARVFDKPDPLLLEKFKLQSLSYFMVVSRMVPENNVETIIKGYLVSGRPDPLLIVGDCSNSFGKYLTKKYRIPGIVFTGPLYDNDLLNNLRYHSLAYFHGHSAGGTNPSLLEAMACGCSVIAHDNAFNRAVLGEEADYFSDEQQIGHLLNNPPSAAAKSARQGSNIGKINSHYSISKVVEEYERLMLEVYHKKNAVL